MKAVRVEWKKKEERKRGSRERRERKGWRQKEERRQRRERMGERREMVKAFHSELAHSTWRGGEEGELT